FLLGHRGLSLVALVLSFPKAAPGTANAGVTGLPPKRSMPQRAADQERQMRGDRREEPVSRRRCKWRDGVPGALQLPAIIDSVQEAKASSMSLRTCASLRPLRAGTWKEWSASASSFIVARVPRRLTTGSINPNSASSSRVPCRKSIGIRTAPRGSARESDGCLGGCRGQARNDPPLTPRRGAPGRAGEVNRRTKEMPPATSDSTGATRLAVETAARTATWHTLGGSGRRDFFSM